VKGGLQSNKYGIFALRGTWLKYVDICYDKARPSGSCLQFHPCSRWPVVLNCCFSSLLRTVITRIVSFDKEDLVPELEVEPIFLGFESGYKKQVRAWFRNCSNSMLLYVIMYISECVSGWVCLRPFAATQGWYNIEYKAKNIGYRRVIIARDCGSCHPEWTEA